MPIALTQAEPLGNSLRPRPLDVVHCVGYTHTVMEDVSAALEVLPNSSEESPPSPDQQATGADG